MSVRFENNSMAVKAAIEQAAIAYLYEASESLASQTADNTRVGTGDTKNAWQYTVDESKLESKIGNTLENSIWEEFGTGEYALHGDGRKGGWFYQDDKRNWHHTYGKKPNRALQNAFNTLKNPLIRRAEEVLKTNLSD